MLAGRDCWNSIARTFPAPEKDQPHELWLSDLKRWREEHLRRGVAALLVLHVSGGRGLHVFKHLPGGGCFNG